MSTRTWALVAVVAATPFLAGCSSPCVRKDQRIAVRLVSTDTLNDVGGGPQHVQYRVWAVRDRTIWESLPADVLAAGDVGTVAAQGLGTSFPTESSWIRPATEAYTFIAVTLDAQYSAVGVAVLYPVPRKALVAVDCGKAVGYVESDAAHDVTFTLDRADVRPGAPASGAARP